MNPDTLEVIEITTADHCSYSVIWLHGLGASGHDFEPIVPELEIDNAPGVRFIFPHAPVRPITINGGAPMRGWYDIDSLDFGERKQDTAGIRESAQHVEALINAEVARGIPAGSIILAGFSQGGAIALFAGLTSNHQLRGIMALSTYLPIHEITLAALTDHAKQIPVFMAHGQFDDVINIRYAEQSRKLLMQHNHAIDWHTYSMAHSVCAEEVADISVWLKRQLVV